ncbi:hypothetical protein [Novosphingobium mangrovi (ex Huang et al. 2023)]|uniref:Uncharacterized protein n=1 Tax=Novosphingobium mangrovi (ex Huang et al. 2023) TaxID=2976432 RepID=A0ABT2I3W7_9SPHN|nr:hypothetical protein [Novosphingobium mangrovi (ex Huang et al. 2023)]MCT2399328.1 hypothetical protein [Novosphingobium mangrovi (ex Huang et al. 2023)]
MIDRTPRPDHPRTKSLPRFTPVPRKCERHDGWTPERQRGFIEALADTGSVRAAAHAVNMTPEGAYLLRRHPKGQSFRKAWEAALALGVQRLEDVAMERALYGIEVPVYSYGKRVGTRRVFNDALLMFLLRNRAPHRFAADSLHNLDAATQSSLQRLKKEWRKQWEEEQQAERNQSSEEILASIDAQIDKMRQRHQATMSERTRRLWEAYQKSNEADQHRPRALPAPDDDEEEDNYRED